MKEFLAALKYFFLALGLILLEQLPAAFITANQPFWQPILITLALLAVTAFTVYVAKQVGLLNHLEELKTWQAWKTVLIGFVMLTVVGYIGKIILLLENGLGANTENRAAFRQLGISPFLLIVLIVIAASIVEEAAIRGLILGRTFSNSYFGVIISSLLFGLSHMPTNIGGQVIYGGMGIVFDIIYYKTQKLGYTIAIRFINNALGVLLMLLL